MKITAIEISHHRLPLEPPFCASWDTAPRRHFDATVTRVHTDQGLSGVGSGDRMVGFDDYAGLFVGWDPMAIERHARILSHIQFHESRCWPLDLALWDLAGKITGQPCYQLLGGLSDRVPAYASSGTLHPPEALAEQAAAFMERGFKAMKIRFHRGDWRDDVRALEQVRERVGEGLELMVDCNQGWRMPWDAASPWTWKDALQVARALEPLGIYWMEEPLHRADYEGHRRLREATDIRIAGGEMTRELSALREGIVGGCFDVIQPDVALVGGITGLRRIAHLAELYHVTFTPHTWTNGLGVVANAHLTAGMVDAPWLEFPYDPPQWDLKRRDFLLQEPLDIDANGDLCLPSSPGLGVELNEELLAKTRI